MIKWMRINTHPCLPMGKDGKKITESREHTDFSRRAASEGMVLLENHRKALPLKSVARVALFGTGQFDYVTGGGGSGAVYTSYYYNIYDGFKIKEKQGKVEIFDELSNFYEKEVARQYKEIEISKNYYEDGKTPSHIRALSGYYLGQTAEPEIPSALLKKAAAYTDTAIITIKRFSGEGCDRTSEKGDFYLTDAEQKMIDDVTAAFKKTVLVLNIGGMIDSSFFKSNDKIDAVLLAWQSGQEGGLAVADVICGDVNPSGKLTDTFVGSFDDYPSSANFHESDDYVCYTDDIYVGYRYFETVPNKKEKVLYPFGFGLSYTEFDIANIYAEEDGESINVYATVTNVGNVAGKEVVQVYTESPQGLLGKPARELRAFKKTELLNPGESRKLKLTFKINDMASFDDLGKIERSAFVLEKGDYKIHVGNSVRDTVECDYKYHLDSDRVTVKCNQNVAPCLLKERMTADGSMEQLPSGETFVNTVHAELPDAKAPEEKTQFIKVYENEITLDEFMAQLSDDDLISLIGGKPSRSVTNTGCMAGLEEYGIPFVPVADGPSGVRIELEGVYATAWPIPTAVACTWNEDIAEEIGRMGGAELKENNMGVWLTPGLNIHRNALCGRNFEYYSEDPLISGKMAAATIRGIQSNGVGSSAKHFACNNKETNRWASDSRVSERALREIYLKGFEIVVKESDPYTIMTAYNKINGQYCSENHQLVTGILRNEWGYEGMVTTDWNNGAKHVNEVMAGNDIKMHIGYPDQLREALKNGKITRGDLYARARRVLEMVLKIS